MMGYLDEKWKSLKEGYKFLNYDDSVNPNEYLADIHNFNSSIFKLLDFIVFRVMKLVVFIVDFLTTFVYAIMHQILFINAKNSPFSFRDIMGTWINNLEITCPKTGKVIHFNVNDPYM